MDAQASIPLGSAHDARNARMSDMLLSRERGAAADMSLIIVVVPNVTAPAVTTELAAIGLHNATVAQTGGLFRDGVTTLLVPCEERRVEQATRRIRRVCATSVVTDPLFTPFGLDQPFDVPPSRTLPAGDALLLVVPVTHAELIRNH